MNSLLTQRVLHQSTDISVAVNDFRTGQYAMTYTSGQYLYIGTAFPFNNAWFEVGATVNAVTATCSVEIWWGNEWVAAAEVFDGTLASGKSLAQSGRIQWVTDDLKAWDCELRSEDVTGLSSTKIYNMFWVRLSWSASLTAGTIIKYIGQKFSLDDDLASHYPDVMQSAILDAFESGKTTWDEQHYMAAEQIIRHLVSNNLVKSGLQLFDPTIFVDASCHKVAEIIYSSFGQPYKDLKDAANKAYALALPKKLVADRDSDGKILPVEIATHSVGNLTR